MTMISDLSENLVQEILSRVPMTCLIAVRCTCKRWNALSSGLSKYGILCKAEARQQFLGFMINNYKMCSMRFDLHGILNEEGEEFVDPSIKEIEYSFLEKVNIYEIFHCDGLLMLSLTRKEGKSRRLVVWNPYLGQTKLIKPRTSYHSQDRYALGYDNKSRNHKILRFLEYLRYGTKHVFEFEIYDFSSDSWRVLGINPCWDIESHQRGQTLKGNTYFIANENIGPPEELLGGGPEEIDETPDFLICFDFTSESFGKFLPLTFHHYVDDTRTLSSLTDEKLAALYKGLDKPEVEVWVTSRIEPDAVSWIPFLKVNLDHFNFYGGSFFIDEEKKLAVVFDSHYEADQSICYQTAYVIPENGDLKKVHIGESVMNCCPLLCSYVPSLVQIQPITRGKRKSKRESR
ncbi:unnamed protein product [Microthlaspi erraticum]|uniref:F-box domain-containing protein n=1 Tax=Microthlaspi erraticum TaxID=1685480 RepID=A0A6D2IT29_9BRAS|nr:unnamed protein product [Microthlaspi erraticum]